MGSDSNQSITEILISAKQAECWNNIPTELAVQNTTDLPVTEKTRCPRHNVTPDIDQNTEQSDDCKKDEKTCKNEIKKAHTSASFKALNIKPGCEFAVCCSYINSPSDLWCQPLDKVSALEELMNKIQLFYSTHKIPLQSGASCCVAKSPQDGRWYRAFITDKQKDHARVMLIDYGCTIQIKKQNLQAILPEYVHMEGLAFRCSLYNQIEPANTSDCLNWSLEVCNFLKDFVQDSTSGLRCKVVSQLNMKNKGLSNVVDLYNSQTKQSITGLLLEQGLAREATMSTKQQSTVFPESFVYSSYSLNPGNEELVYVTHISSQLEVYCHLERNIDMIEELEKKISEESEKMMQASTRAVVKKLCLAKYLDGKWYRGMTHLVQSPLHLCVFFVDYGNTRIADKSNVMFIPRDCADLLYTPMQAIKCSLASVSKKELYADVKDWLDKAVVNKQMRALIVGKNEDGSFDVELFDGEVSINEKVKELISHHSPKPETVVSTNTNHGNLYRHKSQREGHSSNSVASPVCSGSRVESSHCKNKEKTRKHAHSKAQSKNLKVKQQNEKTTASCITVKSQKNSPVKKQRQYCWTDTMSGKPQCTEKMENPQLSSLSNMKMSEGFKVKCFTSHIDSVNSFFLQLLEDEPAILKMGRDLNSGNVRDYLKPTTSLSTDDLVLAEYEEDGALYRSVVRDYEGSSCVKVEFVDYGNSAVIGKEKIFSIPKEYLSQPRFCIPCSLLDTSTYKSDASFTDAVMEKPLMVDFVSQYGSHWKVRVEILDETVGLPVPLEAAVERNTKAEKHEEASTSSPDTEERVRSCEQSCLTEVNETQVSECATVMPAVDGKNLMLKPPPAALLAKLQVITCRHHRRRPTRTTKDAKKNQSRTVKFSVKGQSDYADSVIPLTIKAKDTENCAVLSVLSNGSFYVGLNRTSELLSALERCIEDNLYDCETVTEEDVKQGLLCLVQVHKDKEWHRAMVQHVCREKCQVLLMDLGITEEIPSCSVRQLCKNLRTIPRLAVLCKVNCFGFTAGEGAHQSWCETLKPMIGKEVKLIFVSYSGAERLWKVEIIINGLFLIRQITTSAQQIEKRILLPAEIHKEKAEGKSILDTSRPQQLVFAPVDIDKAYSGFAAAVTTPFEFCVVLEDSLLAMNKVSIMLDNLPGQMCPLPEAHLVTGTCCLFKSNTKKRWCRAEIVQSDTTVILNLVDHGHYECIQYENCSRLKRLPLEISSLPKVTYPCILRGVKPVRADGQWTDEAAVFFQQCLYQKNLQIFFREFVSNTHWKVDILADDVHIAKELVEAGHASYIDIMLGLRYALYHFVFSLKYTFTEATFS